MEDLKELKKQRKILNEKIKQIESGHETIDVGDCTLRFYNKNYPQMNEQINLSIQRYGAFGKKHAKATLFYESTKEEAYSKIQGLISDLQEILKQMGKEP